MKYGLKYNADELINAVNLLNTAWENIRQARQISGVTGIAWLYQIDLNGIANDLDKLALVLGELADELTDDGEEPDEA
jgi:protein involved in ribonucleotide reduction